MNLIDKKKIGYLAGILLALVVVLVMAIVFMPQKAKKGKEIISSRGDTTSFTFFDIGSNTPITKTVRETLSQKLGSETLAEWSPIDLSMNYGGFLQKYSNGLYELNLRLNDATGARIEHNTITLTYRYPPKDQSLFNYVRLMFSNYNQKPLFFIMQAQKEGPTLLNTLKTKYGEPTVNHWDKQEGVSYHWHKGKDVLIFSQSTNRIGNPEFHIHIYFVDNMNEMLLTEKKEALKKAQEVDRGVF